MNASLSVLAATFRPPVFPRGCAECSYTGRRIIRVTCDCCERDGIPQAGCINCAGAGIIRIKAECIHCAPPLESAR